VYNMYFAYLKNPWLRWYWEHGGEEIIGPHGPFGHSQAGLGAPGHAAPGPSPEPWHTQNVPRPEPWRAAVAQLVHAAEAKALASHLPEGRQRSALEKSADSAISAIVDDLCPRPPRWPWPGPPPWLWAIISDLSHTANTLQAGRLRDGLLDIAGLLVQRGDITGG
jgi:hypothetical protein